MLKSGTPTRVSGRGLPSVPILVRLEHGSPQFVSLGIVLAALRLIPRIPGLGWARLASGGRLRPEAARTPGNAAAAGTSENSR